MNAWDELFEALDDGSYINKYCIGDEFPIDLVDQGIIHMQIAGFDKDLMTDCKSKAKVTLISKEPLKTDRPMDASDNNGKTYLNSNIKAYICYAIFHSLPLKVLERIALVSKMTDDEAIFEKIWVPSYNEVFGVEDKFGEPHYNLFDVKSNRMKDRTWWLRNTYDANLFHAVDIDGSSAIRPVNQKNGIVFGFCVN